MENDFIWLEKVVLILWSNYSVDIALPAYKFHQLATVTTLTCQLVKCTSWQKCKTQSSCWVKNTGYIVTAGSCYTAVYLPSYLPTQLPIYLPIHLPTYLRIYVPTQIPTYLQMKSDRNLYYLVMHFGEGSLCVSNCDI